jgi:hypothetical protein
LRARTSDDGPNKFVNEFLKIIDSELSTNHRAWILINDDSGAMNTSLRVTGGGENPFKGACMARAEAASASTRSDSIKGLAQSIAKPAYRRLLIAEPALRRAVPALIIAFLLTIGVGAIVQVLDHRRQVMVEAISELETMADFVAERLERLGGEYKPGATPRNLLDRATLPRTTDFGRRLVLSNSEGIIVATSPTAAEQNGRRLLDVLGDAQPLTILGSSAGVLEITLADGTRAIADEHVGHAAAIAALRLHVDALARAAAPVRDRAASDLYRELALFVGENLVHMQHEETHHNAVLWATHTDAELVALENTIKAHVPPAMMPRVLRWMLPAATPAQRAQMLAGMRAHAPAAVFEGVLAIARAHLDPAGFRKLDVALAS